MTDTRPLARDGEGLRPLVRQRVDPVRRRVPSVVAWALRFVSMLSLVSMFMHSPKHQERWTIDALTDGTRVALIVMLTAVVLVVARGVARRKRRAWRIVLGAVLLATLLYLHSHTWSAAGLNIAVAVLLIWTRREFTAVSEPDSRWLALRAGVLTGAVTLGAGLALTARTAPTAGFGSLLRATLLGLFGIWPQLPYRRAELGDLNQVALTTLGACSVAIVLFILMTPRRKPAVLAPADEDRLRALLSAQGERDSLGYFALRRDKSVLFSPSGKAAVVYRVLNGVTLASGDPIGDPEAWPGAIAAWLAEADRYAWVTGVLGTSHAGATAYLRAGMDALEIGDEAVLELDAFTLDGRDMRGVRQAVARVRRSGYTTTVVRQSAMSESELEQVAAVAETLRGGAVERGFSMALGRLGDSRDGDVVVVRGYDAEGTVVAVLSLVPWGSSGLSLDIMRRSRSCENGTVEFLVASLAEHAKELGVRRLSLNFAVFRSTFERGAQLGAGPVLRLWRSVLLIASRWWQIETLYRANAKYRPTWVPRFVCFARASDLPRVAVAALEAEAFVVRPNLSRWLRPGR